MMEQTIDFRSGRIASLLCMPEVLTDLLTACLEDAAAQKISDIVLQDAPFAAKLIDVAVKLNGEPLDPREPVTAAVESLGSQMITGLALHCAHQVLNHTLTPEQLTFLMSMWRTSRFTGQAARCIAPSVNYPAIEEAQLCGLLQNLGIYLLFMEHQDYLADNPTPWSRIEQVPLEKQRFALDHLQLGAEQIDRWGLDSFLGDTIRFLCADSRQLESANPLFRIARLAQSFGSGSDALSSDTVSLGERFFSLRQSETDYLFDWIRSLIPPPCRSTAVDAQAHDTFSRACQRLAEQVMLVAGQEAARSRLASWTTPEDVAKVAASLYHEAGSATSVQLFLYDQRSQDLVGLSVVGQSRLSREIKIPMLVEASLVARALELDLPINSFSTVHPLTVTDQLLLRLSGGHGIMCHPLRVNSHALGVVVFGVEAQKDLDSVQAPSMTMLHPVVGAALLRVSRRESSRLGEGISLLRRINHEVSSPLTIIANYAEVLKNLLTDTTGRELTDVIKREARRIDEIVNYYLNQQELPDFPDQEVDLNQLVRETVDALKAVDLEPRGIVVHYQLQQPLTRVAVLPVLVRQILANLVKNAAEALPPGGEIRLATCEGYCAERHRYVEVCVADNGPGIPVAVRDRLFLPVVSTKGAGHSGAGLSIVKAMVEDLGARISCHSSSSGTSFYLQIPVADEFSLFPQEKSH